MQWDVIFQEHHFLMMSLSFSCVLYSAVLKIAFNNKLSASYTSEDLPLSHVLAEMIGQVHHGVLLSCHATYLSDTAITSRPKHPAVDTRQIKEQRSKPYRAVLLSGIVAATPTNVWNGCRHF